MEKRTVRVRVPATTANLGPGFDCLGMALDMWNEITVEVAQRPRVEISGEGAEELPHDQANKVYQAALRLCRAAGKTPPPLSFRCINRIPLKRGLGSSAAAIVGGMTAANDLLDGVVPVEQLLALAAEMEGHPDNIAPAVLGGMQVVVSHGDRLVTAPVSVPEALRVVLFIPDIHIETQLAREVIPSQVLRNDAVYNLGRVALLVNAFATGRLQDLAIATDDKLHQPYRQSLFPAMKVIFRAALDSGALGVFLSGSGPTVLALTRGRETTVAYEMAEVARRANVAGQVEITVPSLKGAYVVEES